NSNQSSSEVGGRVLKLTKVGPWILGKVIGKGSSGTVRIATHNVSGQTAAVKIMSTETIVNSRISVAAEPDQAERIIQSIEREIVLMKLIEHPNVLGLLDVWEAKGLLFVIMEYINGGELYDYIVEKGRLPVPEALHYFQQIMYAVAYCHQFRIAHRDLKPENILMDKNGNIKVADFGLAAFVPRDSLLYTSCGSPHYASPEVVSGLAYNGTVADIWSCGVILYALLSGQLPFDDEDIRALLDQVRAGKYTIPADIPWPAQNLIRRMMEKDVDRRIESKPGPFVPINGPEMEEDMFFHQITEMLVNMSNQEPTAAPEKKRGTGLAKAIGEKLGAALEIKLPASQVAPPPTTPVTPTFKENPIEASESVQPTVRAVPKVLEPLNVINEPRESKGPVQVVEVVDKENAPFTLSKPPRARSKTVSAQPQPVKKHVRIVTPDRDAFIRPRKRIHSANKESSAPLALPPSSENWFSNLFHLKSTRHDLYSVHDVYSTRSQCIASLRSLGVRVEASEPQPQSYGGITLRCQLDSILDPSGTTVVSKALKFQVEIRPSNGLRYAAGYLSEIAFVLDKGSPASFTALYERVKVGWEMHVSYRTDGSLELLEVDVGPMPSPALTVGGRYAEV
ncbi:unnamed protein product, partial [Rhizoctonia solani]